MYTTVFSRIPVPPSGGSLEIGNKLELKLAEQIQKEKVPPSGGSLEIGN